MITDADIERLLKTAELEEAIRKATFCPMTRIEMVEEDGSILALGIVMRTDWFRGKSIIRWLMWGGLFRNTTESIYDPCIKPVGRIGA